MWFWSSLKMIQILLFILTSCVSSKSQLWLPLLSGSISERVVWFQHKKQWCLLHYLQKIPRHNRRVCNEPSLKLLSFRWGDKAIENLIEKIPATSASHCINLTFVVFQSILISCLFFSFFFLRILAGVFFPKELIGVSESSHYTEWSFSVSVGKIHCERSII